MFWIRLRSSIILVIAALFLLLTGGWVLAAGLFVLSLIAFRELMRAAKAGRQTDEGKEAGKGRFGILEWIGFLGTAVYYTVLLLEAEPVYWLGVLGLVFLGMMAAYVVTFPSLQAGQVMTAFFLFLLRPRPVFLHLADQRASGRHLYGLADLHQLLDLRYLRLSVRNGAGKA